METSQNKLNSYQITVCVPIYNTERWLSQCLDSLVAQDIWEKLFVILVDDGSEDGSFKIAQKFSQEHSQKTLLLSHVEHKGTLVARYSAIMQIKTPFAMFVDSDDLLPPSACSALYEAIVAKKADVVMGQMRTLNGSNITNKNTAYMDRWFQHYRETDNLRLQDDFRVASLPLCGKIYRSIILKATVYETNGRAFPAISYAEDDLLSTAIFMKAKKFFLKNKIVYYYRVNNESITHNIRNEHIIECFLVSLNIWKLSIYYHCFKLAEQGERILNLAEYRFFNSELCFPYSLKMLNILASMNKIANELGGNFQRSLILEQENKLIKEFGIPKLFEVLEIPEYSFYNLKEPEQSTETRMISSRRHYYFRRPGFKGKIWAISRTLNKRLKLYRTLRSFIRTFMCAARAFIKRLF